MSVRLFVAAGLICVCLAGSAGETGIDSQAAMEEVLGPRPAAVRRTVESAPIIVEAMTVRFLQGTSSADARVTAVLKGDLQQDRNIVVDFEKQPYGLWPRRGERVVLMLAPAEAGGSFVLAGYSSCVLPASATALDAVAGMLDEIKQLELARLAEMDAAEPAENAEPVEAVEAPERVQVDAAYAEMIDSAETVLVGALSGVTVKDGMFRALLCVEYGLLGYAGYERPVVVSGAAGGSSTGAGRYAVFLKGSDSGDVFVPVSEKALVALAGDATVEARVMRAVDSAVDELGLRRSGLTSVQALLCEWRQAWNAGDLDRLMRCYSMKNPLRQAYAAGGPDRERLLSQMREFPGKMSATLGQVRRAGIFSASGGTQAEAQVFLSIELGEQIERHGIRMMLVLEDGEWRILNEGL